MKGEKIAMRVNYLNSWVSAKICMHFLCKRQTTTRKNTIDNCLPRVFTASYRIHSLYTNLTWIKIPRFHHYEDKFQSKFMWF